MRFQKLIVFGVLMLASLATGSSSFAWEPVPLQVFEEKIVKDIEALDAKIRCQDGESVKITFEKTQIALEHDENYRLTFRFNRTPASVSKQTLNGGETRYFIRFYNDFGFSLSDYHHLVVVYSIGGKIKHIRAGTTREYVPVNCALK